jgi:predicted nuclease of restriction endonuclease-like (RecB) superfamily
MTHKSSKMSGKQTAHMATGDFYEAIVDILRSARSNAYRAVNFAMVEAYWNIGKRIIDEEQHGQERAEYGKFLIKNLSLRLTEEFGKGFDERELRKIRQFFAAFPIRDSLRPELSWTHYRTLIRVEKEVARLYYLHEAADQNWSVRALERQINSLYYERLNLSRDKKAVIKEMKEKTISLAGQPQHYIKDPYVLEFLGLPDKARFRESDLEQSIISKLQDFMLELGKGFAFVARQQRISTDNKDFFVDLVFYNCILKCYVLIDLKTGELTHQDIGQMDMYVRLYEDKYKNPDDNPTIGIILCTEKDETVVKYSVLKGNKRLFASKYKLYLPTEKELIAEIEREKKLIISEQRERYKA